MPDVDDVVMFTDPAFLDGEIPAPHTESLNLAPLSDSDSDSSDSVLDFDPSTGHSSGWESRKPPTVVMALEALNHLGNVLRPLMSGTRKRTKDPRLNGWSKAHLDEVERMLNLVPTFGVNFGIFRAERASSARLR